MRIVFTVTNDLSYDQRMQRICGTLAGAGHSVTLVGRALPHSVRLDTQAFAQKRLTCLFNKGFPFYAEFNIRLFIYLLFKPYDAVCSIDLDTLSAGWMASLLRRKKRVFDAHEYFTEVPEVVHRPFVKATWNALARICLPFYKHAYTVGPALSELLEAAYGVKFEVIRNVPKALTQMPQKSAPLTPKTILYQGALNEGRGIEIMLEAMQSLENVELVLAGEGDLSHALRKKAGQLGLGERVRFLGFVKPEDLKKHTQEAWLGLNLLEHKGLSYYYSLANKFFDCVQAGVPVLTMDFPEYRALNNAFEVALLLPELSPDKVASAINQLLHDPEQYHYLQQNCLRAGQHWNWEKEQNTLLAFWEKVEKEPA